MVLARNDSEWLHLSPVSGPPIDLRNKDRDLKSKQRAKERASNKRKGQTLPAQIMLKEIQPTLRHDLVLSYVVPSLAHTGRLRLQLLGDRSDPGSSVNQASVTELQHPYLHES